MSLLRNRSGMREDRRSRAAGARSAGGAAAPQCARQALEARRARVERAGVRRKRASWCSARIRPWISNSSCSASVSARRWPSSMAIADRALERLLPGAAPSSTSASRTGPGPVVELDRAADVDAARVDLDRDAPHPAVEQRAQARQAARLAHRRDGTPLPRTWRGTRGRPRSAAPRASRSGRRRPTCSSASPRRARRSTSPSRPMLRRQRQRRVENRGAGLAALHQRARGGVGSAARRSVSAA